MADTAYLLTIFVAEQLTLLSSLQMFCLVLVMSLKVSIDVVNCV